MFQSTPSSIPAALRLFLAGPLKGPPSLSVLLVALGRLIALVRAQRPRFDVLHAADNLSASVRAFAELQRVQAPQEPPPASLPLASWQELRAALGWVCSLVDEFEDREGRLEGWAETAWQAAQLGVMLGLLADGLLSPVVVPPASEPACAEQAPTEPPPPSGEHALIPGSFAAPCARCGRPRMGCHLDLCPECESDRGLAAEEVSCG